MNAVIQATAVVVDRSIRSSIGLAAAAGTQCIERAGIAVDDVDLLINVGVYRDNNMVEPAMAALIQKQIGINLDYVKSPSRKAAFGVDLMNGACGVLNAMQVARARIEEAKLSRQFPEYRAYQERTRFLIPGVY